MSVIVQKIAAQKLDHGRISAAILTKVDDDSVGVRQKIHGRHSGLTGWFYARKIPKVQITDISFQELHLLKPKISLALFLYGFFSLLFALLLAFTLSNPYSPDQIRIMDDTNMFVFTHTSEIFGQNTRKLINALYAVILPFLELCLDKSLHLFCRLEENIFINKQLADALCHIGFSRTIERCLLPIICDIQTKGRNAQEYDQKHTPNQNKPQIHCRFFDHWRPPVDLVCNIIRSLLHIRCKKRKFSISLKIELHDDAAFFSLIDACCFNLFTHSDFKTRFAIEVYSSP